jgi:hypothetical protein
VGSTLSDFRQVNGFIFGSVPGLALSMMHDGLPW